MTLGPLEKLGLFAKFADILPDVMAKDLTPCMPYTDWLMKHISALISVAEQAKGIGRETGCTSVDTTWLCSKIRQTVGELPPPGIENCLLQFTDIVSKWTELPEDCARDFLAAMGKCNAQPQILTIQPI